MQLLISMIMIAAAAISAGPLHAGVTHDSSCFVTVPRPFSPGLPNYLGCTNDVSVWPDNRLHYSGRALLSLIGEDNFPDYMYGKGIANYHAAVGYGDNSIQTSTLAVTENGGQATSRALYRFHTSDEVTLLSASLPFGAPVLLEITHRFDFSWDIGYWNQGWLELTLAAFTSRPGDTGLQIDAGPGHTTPKFGSRTITSYVTGLVGNPFQLQHILRSYTEVIDMTGIQGGDLATSESFASGRIRTSITPLFELSPITILSASGFVYTSPVPEVPAALLLIVGLAGVAHRVTRLRRTVNAA